MAERGGMNGQERAMRNPYFKAILFFIAVVLLAPAARAEEIYLSVAHSMKEAVDELADSYGKAHPGVTFVRNYGASGALAKQIEAGAPADIFISANREWMERLKEQKAVDAGSIETLAYNVLVFAGKGGGKVAGMDDLPALSRIAIGSPRSVPAGEYAEQALKRSGVSAPLAKKLIMARDVREALLYAERGEVDGAFVYRTDVLRSKGVKVLFVVPQELYGRVVYPGALTVSGSKKAAAVAFLTYLRSGAGKTILEKKGFVTR
jgi:molybdate transport system substrate-binding protein